MTSWTPTTRTAIDLLSLTPGGGERPDVIDVKITLSEAPAPVWAEFFNNPTDLSRPADLQAFLRGATVTFRAPEDQWKEFVSAVDDSIRQANERYERETVPELDRQEARHRAALADAEARTAHLEELRQEAKSL